MGLLQGLQPMTGCKSGGIGALPQLAKGLRLPEPCGTKLGHCKVKSGLPHPALRPVRPDRQDGQPLAVQDTLVLPCAA